MQALCILKNAHRNKDICEAQEIFESLHKTLAPNRLKKAMAWSIGVQESILLGGRKKFALKITICPETNFFSLIRVGTETFCKSVLYSWIRLSASSVTSIRL